MKVTATGDRLNILITCAYLPHHDWMAFASWYSIYRNLPDAEVAILCARGMQSDRIPFNWPYRCDIRYFQHENIGKHYSCPALNKPYAACIALTQDLIREPFFVIDCDVMALRSISSDILEQLNDPDITFGSNDSIWYFQSQGYERFIEVLNTRDIESQSGNDNQKILDMMTKVMGEPHHITNLCSASDDNEIAVFSHYNKCGRFDKNEWIKSKKSQSPFMYASQLGKDVHMTADEQKIIKLWSQMRSVYDMVK